MNAGADNSIVIARNMLSGSRVPAGWTLVGYIDRHPSREGSWPRGVIANDTTGVECAWNGTSIESLPRNWRGKVGFEAAGLPSPIVEQLRAAVERSGLTTYEIARRAGMQQPAISRALAEGANPTARTIDAIMRACAPVS